MSNRILAIIDALPIGDKRKAFLEKCKKAKEVGRLAELLSAIEAQLKLPSDNNLSNEPFYFSKAIGEHFVIDEETRAVTFLESGIVYSAEEVELMMPYKNTPSLKFLHEQKKAFDGTIIPEPSLTMEEKQKPLETYRKPPKQEIKPIWDYGKIDQYKSDREHICPICQHKAKYSVCPACYFQRGSTKPMKVAL